MKRWYVPILLSGAALLGLLVVALTAIEVLVAGSPNATASRAWTPPFARADEALRDGDLAAFGDQWKRIREISGRMEKGKK